MQKIDEINAYSRLVLAVVTDKEKGMLFPLREIDICVINAIIVKVMFPNDRRREILRLRFGLRGERHTLEELSSLMGISHAAIRTDELKAIRALQQPMALKFFRVLFTTTAFSAESFEDSIFVLERDIRELNLSTRAHNAVRSRGIKNIGQLCKADPYFLLKAQNFGFKSLCEVEAKLEMLGLKMEKKLR
jgi:hypothetical protein